MKMESTKKIPASKKKKIPKKVTAPKKKELPAGIELKKEEMSEKKGVEFHGFTFSSTPIEEAIFAHIVKRINGIQFPTLYYSHIRGAVHSWVSGTAIDAVILMLLTNDIMERTDYKGRPALQFRKEELRKYPVKNAMSGRKETE